MNKFLAAAAVSVVGFGGAAQAAMFPVGVDTVAGVYERGIDPSRTDPTAALTPGGAFYSLGLGGLAVFDLGGTVGGRNIMIDETTFVCDVVDGLCSNHAESVEVFVSASYGFDGDISGFTSVGSLGNADAQAGEVLTAATTFQYIAVLDTTDAPTSTSFDGFDIDVIKVVPIPVPASIVFLSSAMFGVLLLSNWSRRHADRA